MPSRRIFAFVLVAVLAAGSLYGQVAGRLSGTVVDPSGAGIPSASVSVLVAGGKEAVLRGQTNETGVFSFVTVRPDVYEIAIEAKGFARILVKDVKVSPVQETSLPAVRLEVQSTATTVEVESAPETVQLANAEISSTITSEQVQNLPVLGRQVNILFQTQAGVSAANATTNVNGLRASFSAITLDGVTIQENFGRTNSLDYAPMKTTIDQVAEVTVTTANPNVALGGGATQFVLTTKSGSNDYHGSVYWYNRNSALASNDWFNNQSGIPRNQMSLNQPGASLGGRIIRDKLFFYTNYELFRNRQQSTRLRTVLTDTAKQGIFQYRDTGDVLRQVNLPSLRQFAIDPTMKGMFDLLPAPNATGAGDGLNTSAYRFNSSNNDFRDQLVFKGDYYLNARHSLSGTYNYIDNPTDRPELGSYYTTRPSVTNAIKNHMMALSWRWAASPTFTNELRGGFLRTDTGFIAQTDYTKFIVAGIVFNNPYNTFLSQGRGVHTYNVQNNATWSKRNHDFSFGVQGQIATQSPFNDAGIIPTYTLGISTANPNGLTAADLPGVRTTDLPTANAYYSNLAGFVATAAQTFNVTSTTSGFVPGAANLRQLRQSVWAAYAQDKWRVRRNLTVNLGLRYEYWSPMDEKNGLFLAPRVENNDLRASVLNPDAVLDFIGGPSGRPFYRADKVNFAPNVGFAWDPFSKGKTSVRGGYSISFVNDNMVTTVRGVLNQNSGLGFPNTQTNLNALLSAPPSVSAPAYKAPRTLADNFAITTTSFLGIPDPNLRTPYVHQWNLGVQHDLKGTIVSARYVGNRGQGLYRSLDYNQVLYNANGFLADFQRAQGNARLSQAAGLGYNGSYNANIAGSQPLTVFPLLVGGGNLGNATIQQLLQRGEIGELANQYMLNKQNGPVNFWPNRNVQGARVLANHGFSNYHALQLEATRRTRSGLQAQFNYTWSKGLSNAAGNSATNNEALLDNNNPGLEYTRTPFDLRHVFKANAYYQLPFGKGKRWSGGRVMNAIAGGWAVSGIWTYQSGTPYSILSGYGTLNRVGNATQRLSDANNTASLLADTPNLMELTSGVWKTGKGVYFVNPAILNTDGRAAAAPGTAPYAGQIFTNPSAGTLGTLQRRMFSGPWQLSLDAAVQKSVTVAEGKTLDLHFQMFNVFNHPVFYINASDAGDYGVQAPFSVNSTTFGQYTVMSGNPRVIQLGAYFRF